MKHTLENNSWLVQDAIPSLPYDFDTLWALHPANLGQIKMYDKIIETPRYSQCYGVPYWYSGMLHTPTSNLPVEFEPFKAWAKDIGTFNQILINWYESGEHYISKHTDDEKQIVPNSPILSISLGSTRTFRIRKIKNKEIILDLPMPDQSYVIMGGEIQKHYTHEVPKTVSKKTPVGQRINITFRTLK